MIGIEEQNGFQRVDGTPVPDAALSTTSTNSVQNKTVTAKLANRLDAGTAIDRTNITGTTQFTPTETGIIMVVGSGGTYFNIVDGTYGGGEGVLLLAPVTGTVQGSCLLFKGHTYTIATDSTSPSYRFVPFTQV